MATHRALVLESRDSPPSLKDVPRPVAGEGAVVVRVLATGVMPYANEIFNGTRPYPMSLPLTPGSGAIARVEEVGSDATTTTPGQLVYCELTVRGRDDPDTSILLGIHGGLTPGARKLMDGPWRNSTYAEYAKFPLENIFPLDEDLLTGKMRYTPSILCGMAICMVPFGGLSDMGVKPGDSVIVAPATGKYGGAAVAVALAMGARVIAAGRNASTLRALQSTFAGTGRFFEAKLTGDFAGDSQALLAATPRGEGADYYIDLSPPAASKSTHIKAAISSLRTRGTFSFMGGIMNDVAVPYPLIMFKNLQLKGRFMYDRHHVLQMIKMIECGNLKLGEAIGIHNRQTFKLDEASKAFDAAAAAPGYGNEVVLEP